MTTLDLLAIMPTLPEHSLHEGVLLDSHGKYCGTDDGHTDEKMRAYGEACMQALLAALQK